MSDSMIPLDGPWSPAPLYRQVDDIGRIVLPSQWRRGHGYAIYAAEDGRLLLVPSVSGSVCSVCGYPRPIRDIARVHNSLVCVKCAHAALAGIVEQSDDGTP